MFLLIKFWLELLVVFLSKLSLIIDYLSAINTSYVLYYNFWVYSSFSFLLSLLSFIFDSYIILNSLSLSLYLNDYFTLSVSGEVSDLIYLWAFFCQPFGENTFSKSSSIVRTVVACNHRPSLLLHPTPAILRAP